MTDIKVDNIADAAGTGLPDFADGLTVADSAVSTLNVAQYYQDSAEPSSPMNGALWKDTANDKLMIYVTGEFKEIELGASAGGPWTVDLSNVTYDSVSFSVAGQDTEPSSMAFNADGTKMYLLGFTGDDVYQYSLSTGFDLSTASYDSVSFGVADSVPFGLTFNTDGTKMYIAGNGSDRITQYTLSTAFDLSTASYDSVSLNVGSQDIYTIGVHFSADGTKMYMTGNYNNSIFQYTLSTAFDLSTASYDNVSLNVTSQDTNPYEVAFNVDGDKMYVLGGSTDSIYQYTLSTAFDLSTASYDNVSVSVASQDNDPAGMTFNADGTKIYIVGNVNRTLYQYSTGL